MGRTVRRQILLVGALVLVTALPWSSPRAAAVSYECTPLLSPPMGAGRASNPYKFWTWTNASGVGTICFDPRTTMPGCTPDFVLDTPIARDSIGYSYAETRFTWSHRHSAATAAALNYQWGVYSHTLQIDGAVVTWDGGSPHQADYLYHGSTFDSTLQPRHAVIDVSVSFGEKSVFSHLECDR